MKRKNTKNDVPDEVKAITADELTQLVTRIGQSSLSDADKRLVVGFITTVATLRALVERRTIGLKSFLRRVFGMKTERRRKRRPDEPPPNPPGGGGGGGTSAVPSTSAGENGATGDGAATSGEGAPKAERKGGTGRNGRDDYPGASRQRIEHATLGPGAPCPVCPDGTLARLADDGVAYRWTGSLPLVLTIYDLERLICHTCKTTFTAAIPGETPDTSKLDPSLPPEAARVVERAADAEAVASLACLRFEMGVPHYRTADAQAARGVPLPPSTQVKMMEPLRAPAEAVFGVLEQMAGNGELVVNDDTRMRILDVERGKVPPPANAVHEQPKPPKPALLRAKRAIDDEDARPRATTTAIVARAGEHTICLHYTGLPVSNINVGKVLAHRLAGTGPPIQMCDALAANVAPEFHTLLGNCLDHARRPFFDLEAYFPLAVDEVLTRLGRVYAFEVEAKRLGFEDDERLTWHQMHSAPEMGELWLWADGVKNGGEVMPSSPLMKPVNYLLRHWDELTLFLRVPAAPLSSAEVERLIKRCIRHRKNSLHYKTLRGARFGDLMMSLIQTCRYARVSAHDYLAALVDNAEAVRAAPQSWLPWSFRQAMAELATSA